MASHHRHQRAQKRPRPADCDLDRDRDSHIAGGAAYLRQAHIKRVCRRPRPRSPSPLPDLANSSNSSDNPRPSSSSETSLPDTRSAASVKGYNLQPEGASPRPESDVPLQSPESNVIPSTQRSHRRSASPRYEGSAQRRRLLPRLNTALPSLPLLPSPASCTSPTVHSDAAFIPSHLPPIRRETLRELDLEAILANDQLRHDILFDPALQFRPLTNRRKRLAAERYWFAVQRELETGCICTSFDQHGSLLPCKRLTSWKWPLAADLQMEAPRPTLPSSQQHQNQHQPHLPFSSRIPALITELREVLLSVMVPCPLPPVPTPHTPLISTSDDDPKSALLSDAFITPGMQLSRSIARSSLQQPQAAASSPRQVPTRQHDMTTSVPSHPLSTSDLPTLDDRQDRRAGVVHPPLSADVMLQHQQVRDILDVPLILQQLAHNVFDPATLFTSLGRIIKSHCAPMRDAAVEDIMATARGTSPAAPARSSGDSNSSTATAVSSPQSRILQTVLAIRRCFDLFELMKLDIANHQLQFIRQYLHQTSMEYELTAIHNHQLHRSLSLSCTRQWIYRHLDANAPPPALQLATASDNTSCRIDRAICDGIVALIFDPPLPSASGAAAAHFATSPNSAARLSHGSRRQLQPSPEGMAAAGYPETLWLDYSRIRALSADVADLTAVYMLLMLYRQTVHSSTGSKEPIKTSQLEQIKDEIWQIGPARLGWCFFHGRAKAASASTTTPASNEEGASASEDARWRRGVNDVILQIARRAREADPRSTSAAIIRGEASSLQGSEAPILVASHPVSLLSSPPSNLPDPATISLLEAWAESNMRLGSPIHSIMAKKLRAVLGDMVWRLRSFSTSSSQSPLLPTVPLAPTTLLAGNGLEPLAPELHHLADRIAKLVAIHSQVYRHVYESPGFALS